MADRVVLHVGLMKSGTSYLQSLLFGQQDRLAASGVLVPGTIFQEQARAVSQALQPGRRGRDDWRGLTREVQGHPGVAVISMEYLGPADPQRARRIVSQLGAEGRTQVIVSARDLNRTMVSMWQETVQNGRSWTWSDYLAAVRRGLPGTTRGVMDRTSAAGTFWRQQHLLRIVQDWSSVVGAERVAVVTVPRPGADRSELARRFAAAADLPLDAELRATHGNESLGLASVLVLRRLNELLDEAGLVFPSGSRQRKTLLAKQILSTRRSQEPGLGLAVEPWVRDQAEQTVAALKEHGVSLFGDWVDLDPVEVPGVGPDDVDAGEVAEAAVAGLAGLVLSRVRR